MKNFLIRSTQQANYSTYSQSSSYSLSSSWAPSTGGGTTTGSFTGSFIGSLLGTASYSTISLTASYFSGSISNAVSSSYSLSSSYSAQADNSISASYAPTNTTGSFTGSFTGSLLGTASYSTLALTSSNALTALTSSYALLALTASYISTASYALNALTSSYALNSLTSSYSLLALTSSYILTASYALNSLTASNALTSLSSSYSAQSDNAISSSYGATGSYNLDGTFKLVNSTDQSKILIFDLTGQTTGKTLTISSSLTTSQKLIIPNITAQDTLATLGLAQTFSAIKTFNGVIKAAATAGITCGNNSLLTYKTGSASTVVTPNFLAAGASTQAAGFSLIYDVTNHLIFSKGNGAAQIMRSSIQLVTSNDTAGSEDGDLLFLTQSGGLVVSTKFRITSKGNILLAVPGALATNATDGFTYIPTCAGVPSGTPTTQTGMVAMIYDTTNNNFYIYNTAWKKVGLA